MSKDCGWGHTTPVGDCDACDSWTHDPNTGWFGFTDHYLGMSFNNQEEKDEYIKKNGNKPPKENDSDWWMKD